MQKNIFKCEETANSFEQWAESFGGGMIHPCNQERFFKFVVIYCKNEEFLSKDNYVKLVKNTSMINLPENRGLAQKSYDQLMLLNDFIKWNADKNK